MLVVKDLQFHYQGGPRVLKKINFTLEDGKFLAILGNNGVGKSTMLKCFNRIIAPDAGEVILNGEDLLKMPVRQVAKRIAFVAQNVPNTQMTVHDMVMLGRRPYMRWGFTEHDHELVHRAMDRLKVSDFRGRFLNQLSGGERQKVMLARGLVQEPEILLLDEPTSNLDVRHQLDVTKMLKRLSEERGILIVMISHDINIAAKFADKVVLMFQGRIFDAGTPNEVITEDNLRTVYGVTSRIVDDDGRPHVILKDALPMTESCNPSAVMAAIRARRASEAAASQDVRGRA